MTAKKYFYENGTPRIFEFVLSDDIREEVPQGEIDGYINLIFSKTLREEEVKRKSTNVNEAVLYGLYKNTSEIEALLLEIEKIKKVMENNTSDNVAMRELAGIRDHQIGLLNHYVLDSIHSDSTSLVWYFKGQKQAMHNHKSFNRVLSEICWNVYASTPVYRNEMVNRSKLSTPILTARKNFVRALVRNWDKKDIGLPVDKFPPEKTIYLSLLKECGIHRELDGDFIVGEPSDKTFAPLWEASMNFLQSSRNGKRNLDEFVSILTQRPFKLKQGFIDFWLSIFLFINKDDYALFDNGVFIPNINEVVLELVGKKPKGFEMKAFDIQGVRLEVFNKYRSFLKQPSKAELNQESFIETIKPFLVFYNNLPSYTRNTKRLSSKTLLLKDAIANAKDPEKAFFEDFPNALGFPLKLLQENQEELEKYITELQDSINEIKRCFNALTDRFENVLLFEILGEEVTFPDLKKRLQKRYSNLKAHMLQPQQRVFHQRLLSLLEDKTAWLSSLAQACTTKSLEKFSDKDEKILYEKIKSIFQQLDDLCELCEAGVDETKEDLLKLEITSLEEGVMKKLIRIPITKKKEIDKLSDKINISLTKDRQTNLAALMKLLQNQFENE